MTTYKRVPGKAHSFPGWEKYALIFTGFILLSFQQLTAQTTLSGRVLDNLTKEPVIGATVIIKSTHTGVTTDYDGNFRFQTDRELPITLTISFIGYRTEEVDIYEPEPFDVFLNEDFNKLSEIVVTGVAEGTSRQKLSFALTKIDNDLINTVPATDASTTLRGKIAGIRVDQSEGNEGASVYLRGAKSISGNIEPLIVVDGFVTGLKLSDINPVDIESIEVVKGAAASALYGTRGEGGIIQILTKKGRRNGRVDITFDNEVGFSNVQRVPPTSQYHHFKVNPDGSFVLNAGARVIDYQENGYSVNLHPYQNHYDNVKNVLNNKSFYTNTLSVSAGDEKYSLYASFQNQYKGGITEAIDTDKNRNVLFNLGYKPGSRIDTEITFQYSSADTPSSASSSASNGVLYSALLLEPFINLNQREPDGSYTFRPDGYVLQGFTAGNPLYELSTREYKYITENLLLGGKIRYRITDHLNAEASLSIHNKYVNSEDYYPKGYQTVSTDVTKNNGYYGKRSSTLKTQNGQIQVNYNRRFGELDFGAALKGVYETSEGKGLNASGYNLTAPVKDLGVTEASTRTIGSSWEKTVNYGYFLNLKAGWKDKLFLDVLGRLDKSSRFGSNIGYAFFPRVSLAYRLTEDIRITGVDELKFRIAYGQAGSLPPFGAKDSKVNISSSGGVSYTQNDNTDLKRAITEETEIGFDALLFHFLNIQFNYAFSKSKHDFIEVPSFTPIAGSAKIYDNLGEVKSSSVELEVCGRVINKKNFSWDTGLTFSRVRSEITSLGNVPEFTDGDYRRAVGASTSAIYGYSIFTKLSQLETDGNGYVTNAGDGTKKVSDYTVNRLGFVVEKSKLGTAEEEPVFYVNEATGNSKIIGDAQPDFIIGFTNTWSYGPFSLYAVIDWKHGGQKFNETVQYLTYQYRSEFSDISAAAGLPLNFTTQVFNAQQTTDYWVENSGYVALREVSFAYRLPVKSLGIEKVVKNARLSVIGRNLFTWTNFTGVNVDGEGKSSGRAGDFFNYPTYRIISAKLTLNF